mmetsp:Transcript_33551/g.84233  ORF Transcript_33551/g.84233 Transcript_33551/m.84233 type:complete len:624 (+) Transcript_33551:506-2377(+)
MALLEELLHVLWRRAACAGLKQAAPCKQRHDGQHLGGRAQLQDGEQVGEVVAQHVACDGDGVLARAGALARGGHGLAGGQDADVHARGVVRRDVFLHLGDEYRVVRAARVQPEDGGHARGTDTRHSQFHPIPHSNVLGLAHAPDVALLHLVPEHLGAAVVRHHHLAVCRDLKRLVVRPVLLGFLRHQAHVGHRPHGGVVKLAVLLAVVDDCLVRERVAAVGDECLGVLQVVVLVPHHAAITDEGRHGRIDDDVVGHVQVGDALGRVHHGQAGAGRVGRLDVRLDLGAQGGVLQGAQLSQHAGQAHVGVDADAAQGVAVLSKHVLEVHRHGVAKDDGVRHLHHGGLQVQRHHHVLRLGVLQLLLKERAQLAGVHDGGVEDLIFNDSKAGLQDCLLTLRVHVGDLDFCVLGDNVRLFTSKEVPRLHVGDMGLGHRGPGTHAHRRAAALCVLLHRECNAAVRVAFTQHRVDSTAQHLGVRGSDGLLLLGLGVLRVLGHVEALGLELSDRFQQLRHGRADVGELDDVPVCVLRQVCQHGQVVRLLLFRLQAGRELGDDAGCQRDVWAFQLDAVGGSEATQHRQEGICGKLRRLVRDGVVDRVLRMQQRAGQVKEARHQRAVRQTGKR